MSCPHHTLFFVPMDHIFYSILKTGWWLCSFIVRTVLPPAVQSGTYTLSNVRSTNSYFLFYNGNSCTGGMSALLPSSPPFLFVDSAQVQSRHKESPQENQQPWSPGQIQPTVCLHHRPQGELPSCTNTCQVFYWSHLLSMKAHFFRNTL